MCTFSSFPPTTTTDDNTDDDTQDDSDKDVDYAPPAKVRKEKAIHIDDSGDDSKEVSYDSDEDSGSGDDSIDDDDDDDDYTIQSKGSQM